MKESPEKSILPAGNKAEKVKNDRKKSNSSG
jgi:hypothetical protein